MKLTASATAKYVFIVFILDSSFLVRKCSNIQPQARPDVAQFRLAFGIVSALFPSNSHQVDHANERCYRPRLYEIPARSNDEDCCLHCWAQAARNQKVRHSSAA